jgi:nucleoside-diphosphate-sugar epimerase
MSTRNNILVIGSAGQIGTDLVTALREQHKSDSVIASDVKDQQGYLRESGPFYVLDALDAKAVAEIIRLHQVSEVYLLAALLSATAEQKPKSAWRLNMESLINVLDIAKEQPGLRIFWPSSIAVFGSTTPKLNTPQHTVTEPSTIYGISKLAGERWCAYYHEKHQVDVRSLRFPGLISYKAHPGGGTTDYAVDIFFKAVAAQAYECYLKPDTLLPMMYMPDAIKGIMDLMNAPASSVSVRSSYNIAAFSFTPQQIAEEIRKTIPSFSISYKPDFRQAIADTWPGSIDDSEARAHWGWKPQHTLASMCADMIAHVRESREVTY